ncbi:MAG TPA: tyrosine-type recombinase/integrase [Ilumatobacter sp.]|nr:tyrosine-type recombinase/integrase [Ilumatobacter sp.]
MSFITATGPKNNRKYRARYRTPDGASRSKTFAKKSDAENFLTSIGHRKLTGDYVDTAAGRALFKDYAAGWLERKRSTTRSTTAGTFASHINAHLAPEFGRYELRAITREHVKAFAGKLTVSEFDAEGNVTKKGAAPTTARAIVFTLAAILREAVDDNRIPKNVAERVKVGSKTERRVDPMHIASMAPKVPRLTEAMPARWSAAVLLMASVGLRLGECLGLTVDRVDFLRRTIRVDRQLDNTAAGTGGFGPPKTRAGVRTIPVPKHITDLLAAHLAEFPAGEQGLIFTTDRGTPISRSRWSDAYRKACDVAGVDGRTRSHDLRHIAASSMIASGLSVAAVQAALGHSSPAETLEVYTHLWPTDEDRTRQAIESGSAGWFQGARVQSASPLG